MNLAFSTGSASMFLPNDATLGLAAAGMVTDNLYVIGGLTNAYADPTDPFRDSFDRYFNDGNETTFGDGLDDQVTAELFYRLQITPQFALTPSVEYIDNPALNPENDNLWVVGLRARMAL